MKDLVPDFQLGDTLTGTNDAGVLLNSALEGRVYEFPVTEEVANVLGLSKRAIGKRIHAAILRNTSGAALLPEETCVVDVTSGAGGIGSATGKAGASARYAYVVDPAIGAAGVADDDLFYGIVKGPTKVKTASATFSGGELLKTDRKSVV